MRWRNALRPSLIVAALILIGGALANAKDTPTAVYDPTDGGFYHCQTQEQVEAVLKLIDAKLHSGSCCPSGACCPAGSCCPSGEPRNLVRPFVAIPHYQTCPSCQSGRCPGR